MEKKTTVLMILDGFGLNDKAGKDPCSGRIDAEISLR